MKFKALLFSLLLATNFTHAATLYVDGINGDDTKDCSTWDKACKTISKAVDGASEGDEIRITKGLYVLDSTIHVTKSLSFIGGFEKGLDLPTGDKASTIISGDKDNNDTNKTSDGVVLTYKDIKGSNTQQAFSLGSGSYKFEHLTFTGFEGVKGDAHGSVIFYANPSGTDNVLSLKDIAVIGNRGYSMGVVMAYATGGNEARVVIDDAVFEKNAGNSGIVTAHLDIVELEISNSSFKDNVSEKDEYGGWNNGIGAVWAQGSSTALNVSNSVFANNTSDGGASAIQADGPVLDIVNSTFAKNVAYNSSAIQTGGATTATTATIRYSTIYNNTGGSESAGGIHHTNTAGNSLSLMGNLILANKSAGVDKNILIANSAINDSGYNLIGYNGASFVVGSFEKNETTKFPSEDETEIVEDYGYYGGERDSVKIVANGPARDAIPYDGFPYYGVGTSEGNRFTSLGQARASVGFDEFDYAPGNLFYFALGATNTAEDGYDVTGATDVFQAVMDADGWVRHAGALDTSEEYDSEMRGDVKWIRAKQAGVCSGIVSTDGRGMPRSDRVRSGEPVAVCDIGAFEYNDYYQLDCVDEDGMRPENNLNSIQAGWCFNPLDKDVNPMDVFENIGIGMFSWQWSLLLLGLLGLRFRPSR